jgi:hypothetical protein
MGSSIGRGAHDVGRRAKSPFFAIIFRSPYIPGCRRIIRKGRLASRPYKNAGFPLREIFVRNIVILVELINSETGQLPLGMLRSGFSGSSCQRAGFA